MIRVELPTNVLDKHRPSTLSTHKVTIQISLWSQVVQVPLEAHLYECPRLHATYHYWHLDEAKRPILPCSTCMADAQGLTLQYRWEYHSDYTQCRGCDQYFSFQKQKPTCAATCPYERVGHKDY